MTPIRLAAVLATTASSVTAAAGCAPIPQVACRSSRRLCPFDQL